MPSKRLGLALAALTATAAALWRPGDAPWTYDEPRLIAFALQNIRAGTVPWHGLQGSHGLLYGPVPEWLYQAALCFTRDLFWLVRLHALVFFAASFAAVWWLARLDPELDGPWGGAALLSPYFWIYGRMLWDNTALIPLSGLAICAYLSFCRKPSALKLGGLSLALTACALTHFMSLIVIAPILAHMIWLHRAWLVARRKAVASCALACAALILPYAAVVLREAGDYVSSPMDSRWRGFLFPLLGGRLFSGLGFGYFLGAGWPHAAAARAASYLSAATIPLVWLGMALAARRLREGPRQGTDAGYHLGLLGLGAVALQCLVYGFARVYGHPHYLGAAWLFNLYFLWSGLSALGDWRRAAGFVYAGALAGILLFAMSDVRSRGGTRGLHYGPTISNQLEVARALGNFKPGPIDMEVEHYRLFPQALSTLMDLYDFKGNKNEPPRALVVVYRNAEGSDGWIKLVVRD